VSIWTDKEGRRHVGIMLAGTRVHRICPKGASARDAKELEGRLRTALGSKREPNVPGDPMLADVMALYIKHADSLRSPDTAKHHALRVGPWVDGKRASEARQVAAQMTQDMCGHYAPATINRSLGALSKALRLAYKLDKVPVDYSGVVERLAENNQRDVVLSLAEVKRLADCASASVRAAIWIAIYTGCRRGEILAIKKADIGADSILLRAGNTKTLKARTVPIIAPLRPWLEHVPLGVNFEGLKTGFRRARIAAGMPHVTFHDLRRSCATLMIQADVDLYVVSKLLGHSSVQVTQARYGYLNDAKIKEGLERTFG
jgi:integrase